MKWIYDNNFQSGQALALDKSEMDVICSELDPVVKKLRKQYEKYKDMHESVGDPCYQELMWYYLEKLTLFEQFISESSNH